jgi:predicted aldo/keto reductase-like oxidoreductase
MTGDHDTDGLDSEGISRRTFVKATGAGLSASGAVFAAAQPAAASIQQDNRVRRYGTLGRTGISISDISFGSSRLRPGEENLVRHALDRGVNYFDTADSYTRGQSEAVIGNALKGDRVRVAVATKTKVWADDDRQSIMRTLEESLRKLKTDYVDVYFNHAVNETDRLDNPEWHEFAETAKKQGKIRFTGFSGHAGRLVDVIDHAVDGDLVDVLLVSYNFGQDPAFYESITRSFDRIATQTGLPAALARAKARNMGVVAMKTLMGGRLNDMRPFESDGATYSQAAFRWTLSNPNVDGLIVSMTDIEQIDEYLGASGGQTVSTRDLGLLRKYATLNGTSYCRQACNDCAGACPYDVPIADVLRTRMYAVDYEDLAFARDEYAALESNASACLGCTGEPCRSACSHGLDIAAWCAPTHRMLA